MKRVFSKVYRLIFLAVLIWVVSACKPAPTPTQPATLPPAQPTSTFTPLPSTATFQPSATPTRTPVPGPYICSPLKDIQINQLSDIISNPYRLSQPGLDDNHFGVDLAFYRYGKYIGMSGVPIQSVFPGVVVSTIDNRPPYGNAIIVETPLVYFPTSFLDQIKLPAPHSRITPAPAMNCPEMNYGQFPNSGDYSLYALYAHMLEPTKLKSNQKVSCGQVIGEVGTTGNSVNEHLHLEIRIGPSGARFNSMAYYDTTRTDEEARNYCTWRVTNIFTPFDPMTLFLK